MCLIDQHDAEYHSFPFFLLFLMVINLKNSGSDLLRVEMFTKSHFTLNRNAQGFLEGSLGGL